MKTAEGTKAVYEATIYRDDELDAAVEQRHLGYFGSVRAATSAINAAVDPAHGWHTGGIRHGFLEPAIPLRRPERFEPDDRTTPWFVGIDGKAVR
jgi:hypothetical protein